MSFWSGHPIYPYYYLIIVTRNLWKNLLQRGPILSGWVIRKPILIRTSAHSFTVLQRLGADFIHTFKMQHEIMIINASAWHENCRHSVLALALTLAVDASCKTFILYLRILLVRKWYSLLATRRCNHPSMVHRVGLVMELKSQSSFSNITKGVNVPKNHHGHDKLAVLNITKVSW